MDIDFQPGERLLAIRGESLAASWPRLAFCAVLALAGWAWQAGDMADMASLGRGACWAGLIGAIWSEAERWGSRLWITDRRVVATLGLAGARSDMPLGLLGPFHVEAGPLGSAWLVASAHDGALGAKLLLIGRAREALAIAEKARQARLAEAMRLASGQQPGPRPARSVELGDDLG